ncbi:fibronectin type III domain-containing protein [uncultured Draconibacterium sp.]|uniref:golvesin C-terminal-like domain-containing protein n=1 Tax=uncultured Draconibacterium sp. TaxID=1573823 RepID=UPI0032169AD4
MGLINVKVYRPRTSILIKVFGVCFFYFFVAGTSVFAQTADSIKAGINTNLKGKVSSDFYTGDQNYINRKKIQVDSVFIDDDENAITLFFNKALAEMPFRKESVESIHDSIKKYLPTHLQDRNLTIVSAGVDIEDLVPNYYRSRLEQEKKRLTQESPEDRKNVVQPQRSYTITSGLQNSNIALWNSHGWYYEPKLNRWEWQRARLFTTVEDILPTALVTPYIAPMLENAGANVFMPRERDWQKNEVIVDNNASTGKSKFKRPRKRTANVRGFAIGNQPYVDENPFELGTSVGFENLNRKTNCATYIPDFPNSGDYSVYVSYGKGDGEVLYRVHHSGGVSDFKVDQSMGFGTWIYLGTFHFKQGRDKKAVKVELLAEPGKPQKISADAVRFGGGMGVVERNGNTSGRARYFEGARYNLQFSGAPDTLVWKLNDNNDYKDDYMCRGEWVNWLMGAPTGPEKNRMYPGLNIPIDMAFAFHTDAGILPDDEIVGTLGIYSTDRDTSVFANGQSKFASRDLTDLIQTQIVNDINKIYQCNWTRRGMWNSQYSEAYRPQVPTMLLELLSHQNLKDVKYMLHPKFRFDVSRAVYKGMLRFLSTQNGSEYVVQPLPVDHLSSEIVGENSARLSWKPVLDKTEPGAIPEKYIVYKRIGDNGFDNGTLVDETSIVVSKLEKGKVYGFKVTAVNAGGESFPSEIISLAIAENSKRKALILNGFDRVDAPEIFVSDTLSGVLRQLDNGVADGFDISTTGNQYDFDRNSPWIDDDSPGHGASFADLETTIFRGNTFDFSYTHGKSLLEAGFSFVTYSDEAIEDVNFSNFDVLDCLFGEEKTSYLPGNDSTSYFEIYSEKILKALEKYAQNGGNILISGAYIGSDIPKNKTDEKRIGELLKFKWRTDHATKKGQFYAVSDEFDFRGEFNTDYIMEQYPVEAADGIEPYNEEGQTLFRYEENNISAGVFYNGAYKVISLGFPFECVKGEKQRDELMKKIVDRFTIKADKQTAK